MQLAIEAAGRQFRDQHHHVRRRLEAWRLGDGGIGTPAALNRQPVGSARHSEDERIRCPRAGVVGRHPLAEPPQVDPPVGVGRGAEVCLLAEHFLGQSLLRHRPDAIGDPLLHEKPQQILEPPRALQTERFAPVRRGSRAAKNRPKKTKTREFTVFTRGSGNAEHTGRRASTGFGTRFAYPFYTRRDTRHGVAVAQIFQYSPVQLFSCRSKF